MKLKPLMLSVVMLAFVASQADAVQEVRRFPGVLCKAVFGSEQANIYYTTAGGLQNTGDGAMYVECPLSTFHDMGTSASMQAIIQLSSSTTCVLRTTTEGGVALNSTSATNTVDNLSLNGNASDDLTANVRCHLPAGATLYSVESWITVP